MNIQKDICQHCGSTLSARWETLSTGLIRCLTKAIAAVHRKNLNRFHWHDDLALTNNESHNFSKLRFHGLIAHADPDHPKSGEWLITARGGAFLRGEIPVPKKVLIFRNKVQDHGTELVYMSAFRQKIPEFQERFAYVPFLMPPKVERSGIQNKLFVAA